MKACGGGALEVWGGWVRAVLGAAISLTYIFSQP